MIKAAVVGVGYLGQFHAEKFAKSKTATLVAVVDTDEARAKKIARQHRAQALTDFRELTSLGIDCASVAADTSQHHKIASYLLDNGVDVLVEKPMTTSVEEAQDLIDRAERGGRILQAGHLERFNPAFRAMEKVLTKPWFFEARRIAPFVGRGIDVDVVLDLMIHDIDIIAHLVGRPVKKVEAVGIPVLTGNIDIANARISFEGGATANVTASRAAFKSERTIRIFQPDVYISLDFGAKKLKMYTKSGDSDEKGFPKIKIEEHKVLERDALRDEIDAFIESVVQRTPPEVSGYDGLQAIKLADSIHDAFRVSVEALDAEEESLRKMVNAGF